VAVGVGVSLGECVGVALAVSDGLGLRVAEGLGAKRVAEGKGSWIVLGAQAAKIPIKMSTLKALFSMPALYQPYQSTIFA
jgi:hypothetical protein